MKILFILSFIFFVASSFAQDDTTTSISPSTVTTSPLPTVAPTVPISSEKPTPEPTSQPPTTPSTASPTPPQTTTPKTTPPQTTTPKTTPPQTTTPKTTPPQTTTPKTTTPQTTTPKTTPQTTSPAPKTTTPPVPVTTKSPVPEVYEGSWNVTSGNTTCIRASLKILFKIYLPDRAEYIALSPNASSDQSTCKASNVTQVLTLTESNYILQFIFEKKNDIVFVRNTSFTYYIGASVTATNNSELFTVKAGNSYMCIVESDVLLDSNVTMEIESIKIQAFGVENNHDFGTAEECEADNKVNDIVPIAVGIALLALVVVVLIAYLIGRRRSRQKGYQSV